MRLWIISVLLVAILGFTLAQNPYAPAKYNHPEPCPKGCRCSGLPGLHRRHHWHWMLAAYRMRRVVFGDKNMGGQAFMARPKHEVPTGREMTCLGLLDMPDYVPNDINKLTMYGDTKGYIYQRDSPAADQSYNVRPQAKSASPVKSYNQLTTINKYAFRRSPEVKELTMEGNRIKVLHPNDLDMLTKLERLNLRNNRLKVVWVKAFGGLTNLKEVDLSTNHLKRLPKATFYEVVNLKKISLKDNRLRGLNRKLFKNLKHLEVLDISFNYLRDMHKDIFYHNGNLKELYIDGNNLKYLRPEWFSRLQQLTKLSLKGNRITESIPRLAWQNLVNLQELNLEKNQLTHVDRLNFEGLDHLQVLKLGKNNITVLEEGAFGNLAFLKELHLDNNDIHFLENKTFAGMDNLEILMMSRNSLLEVNQPCIGYLKHLYRFDLSHNELKIIRERNFYGMLELKDLKLDHNKIKVVEDESFSVSIVNTFSKITWLYLNYNKISHITSKMFYGLPYLKFLNMGQNDVQVIQEGALSMLFRLNTFMLTDNRISRFDVATFKHTKNLRHLDVGNNALRQLGVNAFLGLEQLEDINLQKNEIEEINPETFLDTPKLISLNLKDNKLRVTDLNILETVFRMKYLDLSRNMIERVHFPSFFQRNLFFLSLADNNLESLSENITELMTPSGSLHLYGNPWTCDCHLSWMQEVARRSSRLQLVDSDDIVCKSPAYISGEKVLSLRQDDFQCGRGVQDHRGWLPPQDQPEEKPTTECDFIHHTIRDNTRREVKKGKFDVLEWMVTFFDSENKTLCNGVRLNNEWILSQSECWKQTGMGTKIYVQYGPSTFGPILYATKVMALNHYTGPLDISLVKIQPSWEEDHQRVFPCLLSEEGLKTAKRLTVPGIYPAKAVYVDTDTKVKIRGFPVRADNSITCATDGTSICVSGSKDISESNRYDVQSAPLFVKVGRSKWALAGFGEMATKTDDKHEIHALHSAISWIDTSLN